MRLKKSVQASLLLVSALLGLANVCRAQSPTPTPTSSDYLLGWYIGQTTERLTASIPWVTSSTFAGECSVTNIDQCFFATECSGNTLYYDDGYSMGCGSAYSCVTFTIFQTSPAGLPSASSIGCWQNWSAWTVYRELPTSATSSSSETAETESPTPTTRPAELTPTPTETSDSSSSHSNSSGSNAWIAGAVVGPVAGLAIVGLAAFLYLRRRNNAEPAAFTAADHQNPQYGSYSKPQTSELPGSEYSGGYAPLSQNTSYPLSEMPGTRPQLAYELSATRD